MTSSSEDMPPQGGVSRDREGGTRMARILPRDLIDLVVYLPQRPPDGFNPAEHNVDGPGRRLYRARCLDGTTTAHRACHPRAGCRSAVSLLLGR